jgi:multiple sugar transport system permease protein
MRRRICSIPSRRKDPGRLPVAAAGRLPTVVHEVGDRHALRDCRPVFLDSLAGYALARPHFRGRAGLSALFIGIMAVPAEVLLIPRYLVLVQPRDLQHLRGDDHPAAGGCGRGVHHAAVLRQHSGGRWRSPPGSTALVRPGPSGRWCCRWRGPAVITLTILSFQGSWNELPHFIIPGTARS